MIAADVLVCVERGTFCVDQSLLKEHHRPLETMRTELSAQLLYYFKFNLFGFLTFLMFHRPNDSFIIKENNFKNP